MMQIQVNIKKCDKGKKERKGRENNRRMSEKREEKRKEKEDILINFYGLSTLCALLGSERYFIL